MSNKKPKILFIITKSVWGGAGKYVYDLAVNLSENKFKVCVAAGGQGPLAQKLRAARVAYYDIKNLQRDVSIMNDILAFFEILKLIRKVKPDIVHVNSSKAGGIVGIALLVYKKIFTSKLLSFKSVFTAHGWAFNEARPKYQIVLIKIFSRITAALYNKIICVSEFDKQSAIKNKIAPAKKLTTIHNGISADEYQLLSKEAAIEKLQFKNKNLKTTFQNLQDEKLITIGTIGEFTKNKGQKYLIEAIHKLQTTKCESRTIIVGWGEEISNLKSQISKLHLKDKIFLIENLLLAGLYLKAFDIFVLPSLKEGLPYTLLEAGLAELPVIATNVGGNSEIIEHNKTGILVSPANADEIADAIKFLIENPAEAKNLALNLHKKILQRFSLKSMITKTLEVYENL